MDFFKIHEYTNKSETTDDAEGWNEQRQSTTKAQLKYMRDYLTGENLMASTNNGSVE